MDIKLDDDEFDKIFAQEIDPILAINQFGSKFFEKNEEKLREFMSLNDCMDILYKIILKHTEIKVKTNHSLKKEFTKLDDLFDINEKLKIKDEINNYFNSLPREYTVVFSLDSVISQEELVIPLNENITLKFDNQYVSGFYDGLFTKINPSIPCFSYSLRIYIREKVYITSSSFDVSHSKLKHIIYLAIALGIFKADGIKISRFKSLLAENDDDHYLMDGNDKIKLDLAGNEIDFISRINLIKKDNLKEQIDKLKIFYFKLDEHSANPKDEINKIKTAFKWGYEAKITTNETFKFIITFIAIEAVLGDDHKHKDKSDAGIVSILKNRCAYLLSKSHKERKDILKEFPKLYDLRSKLVHGSQAYLSHADKENLQRSKQILELILDAELNMLV